MSHIDPLLAAQAGEKSAGDQIAQRTPVRVLVAKSCKQEIEVRTKVVRCQYVICSIVSRTSRHINPNTLTCHLCGDSQVDLRKQLGVGTLLISALTCPRSCLFPSNSLDASSKQLEGHAPRCLPFRRFQYLPNRLRSLHARLGVQQERQQDVHAHMTRTLAILFGVFLLLLVACRCPRRCGQEV